jgi:hypothetical protein
MLASTGSKSMAGTGAFGATDGGKSLAGTKLAETQAGIEGSNALSQNDPEPMYKPKPYISRADKFMQKASPAFVSLNWDQIKAKQVRKQLRQILFH